MLLGPLLPSLGRLGGRGRREQSLLREPLVQLLLDEGEELGGVIRQLARHKALATRAPREPLRDLLLLHLWRANDGREQWHGTVARRDRRRQRAVSPSTRHTREVSDKI